MRFVYQGIYNHHSVFIPYCQHCISANPFGLIIDTPENESAASTTPYCVVSSPLQMPDVCNFYRFCMSKVDRNVGLGLKDGVEGPLNGV